MVQYLQTPKRLKYNSYSLGSFRISSKQHTKQDIINMEANRQPPMPPTGLPPTDRNHNNFLQPTNGSNSSDEPQPINLSSCCICLTDIPTSEGLTCPHGHFICDTCLGSYFEARINIRNIHTHKLQLPCPVPECEAPSFAPIRVIATHLPPAAVGLILDNLDKILEILTQEERPKIEQESSQSSVQGDIERIERRRLHIIDNILTLKHSLCGTAFVDFTGCCAVQCDNCPPSSNAFCAICLSPCGADAHAHVAAQHGNMFMDNLEWQTHHNRRRQGQLVEYFRGPGADCDRGALLEALRRDLTDLGMNVEELRALLPGVGGVPITNEGIFYELRRRDEMQQVLVEQLQREQEERKRSEKRRRRWIFIALAFFLVIVALSIVVGVVLSLGNSASATPTSTVVTTATSSQTPTPTSFGPVSKDVLVTYPSPLPQPDYFRPYGPEQAIGPPDTRTYGDQGTAWASLTANGTYEWLLLDYLFAIKPGRIDVYETYNPGAVVEIWVFPPGSNVSALNAGLLFWSGSAQFNLNASIVIAKFYTNNTAIKYDDLFVTSRVLLVIDNTVPGWREIDAVGLVDEFNVVQWALGAAASSSYAGGNYFTVTTPSNNSTGLSWWKILLIVIAIIVALIVVCAYCCKC